MVHSRKMNWGSAASHQRRSVQKRRSYATDNHPCSLISPQDGLGHFKKGRAISREHEHTQSLPYADADYLIDNSDPSLSERCPH